VPRFTCLARLSVVRDAEVSVGDKTVSGYLAFDFTPVGKNKTMEAVRIGMSKDGSAIVLELAERASRVTIPVNGGKAAFPQRLAEEMTLRFAQGGLSFAIAANRMP
jgi:hypothetical protein